MCKKFEFSESDEPRYGQKTVSIADDRRRCGLSLIDKFDFDFPVSMNFIQFEGVWMAESSVEVILALNRCLFFAAPGIARFLFGSTDLGTAYRTWLWMIPPTLWGLWECVFEKPMLFSSITHIEISNPHFGYATYMGKYFDEVGGNRNVSSPGSQGLRQKQVRHLRLISFNLRPKLNAKKKKPKLPALSHILFSVRKN